MELVLDHLHRFVSREHNKPVEQALQSQADFPHSPAHCGLADVFCITHIIQETAAGKETQRDTKDLLG